MNIFLILSIVILVVVLLALLQKKRPSNAPPTYGSIPFVGSGIEFATSPLGAVRNAYEKYGDCFTMKIFGFNMTFLIGPDAHNVFFRATDEELSSREAYRFVTPVFGRGIVYDAPLNVMTQQVKMIKDNLKTDAFKRNVPLMVREATEFFSKWGNSGSVDMLDKMNRLTILTASRVLLGSEIREDPKVADDFARLYHDLEGGMNPIAFFFPYLPIPAHNKRDRARVEVLKLFAKVIKQRRQLPPGAEEPDDMLQKFMNVKYTHGDKKGESLSDDEITGMLLALLFAGQHTSGITAAWTGAFLTKNPQFLKEVLDEQEELIKKYGEEISYDMLSPESSPKLEHCVRESLRMYPPLIHLMRKAKVSLKYKDYIIPEGDLVCVSPGVAMRLPDVFANPNEYNPHRFEKGEQKREFSFLAFGGGFHGCPGERFGILQVKTIWTVLLRNFEFSLPAGKFPVPDYTTLVVGPQQPATIEYRRRATPIGKGLKIES